MASDELQKKIDDAKVEGWEVDEYQGEHRAVMIRRKTGSITAHIVLFIVTFYTFGLANLAYLGYKYFIDTDKRVLRDEDAEASA